MNEQLQFLEHMNAVAQMGKEHNGKITRQEIMKELGDTSLNEEQWEVMGEFLFNRQVILEGYAPAKPVEEKPPYKFNVDEMLFIKLYEEELESVTKLSEEELEKLLQKVKAGEEQVLGLYDPLMHVAYEEAKSYADGTEPVGDLVQEANLKIITLLDDVSTLKGPKILENIKREIGLTLKAFLAEEEDAKLENSKIVDKLNQLVDAVEALKEQSVEYSIEDLSEFLDISVDEIENLLKIAGEE